jgi:hypothetical protein
MNQASLASMPLFGQVSEFAATDEADDSSASYTAVAPFGSSEHPAIEVDAAISSDTELGVATGSAHAVTHSVAHSGKNKVVALNNGSVIFTPSVDTTVQTPFGNVDIDARSIVLVIASNHGLAVYNLDDQHRDAVKIHAGNRTMTLAPSRQAMITHKDVRGFEQVNPIEAIGYRYISDSEIGGNLKAFNSEFSIPSAISAIKPLKNIVSSRHPEAMKFSSHMLKTAAAMMQLKPGSERYQQVLHPRMAAYSQQ